MTYGVPEQDLPENQDPDVRHTVLHATNQKIELDEKGKPTVEMGSNGFPKDADKAETPAPAENDKMPKAKNFSREAKRDQNLDGQGQKKAGEK